MVEAVVWEGASLLLLLLMLLLHSKLLIILLRPLSMVVPVVVPEDVEEVKEEGKACVKRGMWELLLAL